MELKDAIVTLNYVTKNRTNSDKYTLKSLEAIETVLQALENSIPKQKIEDKIKWLDEMLNNPDKEVIYTNYRYTRNILEELLGDKIDEDTKYRPWF